MDLETKIEERKKEAEDKKISMKAGIIAKYLGSGGETYDRGMTTTEYNFNNNKFSINDVMHVSNDGGGGCGTSVEFNGNVVYRDGGGNVHSFVPGNWEKSFNGLYGRAVQTMNLKNAKEKVQQRKMKSESEKELKKNWGL